MHPYPHIYTAAAGGRPEGAVGLTSRGLPEIATASPPEFGGPGGVWSPETLLCASIADCFVLSFRAIARASKVEWSNSHATSKASWNVLTACARFTRYTTFASLKVPSESTVEKVRRLLGKGRACIALISNSLRGERILVTEVVVGGSTDQRLLAASVATSCRRRRTSKRQKPVANCRRRHADIERRSGDARHHLATGVFQWRRIGFHHH